MSSQMTLPAEEKFEDHETLYKRDPIDVRVLTWGNPPISLHYIVRHNNLPDNLPQSSNNTFHEADGSIPLDVTCPEQSIQKQVVNPAQGYSIFFILREVDAKLLRSSTTTQSETTITLTSLTEDVPFHAARLNQAVQGNTKNLNASTRSEQCVRTVVNLVAKGAHIWATPEELRALKVIGIATKRAPRAALLPIASLIYLMRYFLCDITSLTLESILMTLCHETNALRSFLFHQYRNSQQKVGNNNDGGSSTSTNKNGSKNNDQSKAITTTNTPATTSQNHGAPLLTLQQLLETLSSPIESKSARLASSREAGHVPPPIPKSPDQNKTTTSLTNDEKSPLYQHVRDYTAQWSFLSHYGLPNEDNSGSAYASIIMSSQQDGNGNSSNQSTELRGPTQHPSSTTAPNSTSAADLLDNLQQHYQLQSQRPASLYAHDPTNTISTANPNIDLPDGPFLLSCVRSIRAGGNTGTAAAVNKPGINNHTTTTTTTTTALTDKSDYKMSAYIAHSFLESNLFVDYQYERPSPPTNNNKMPPIPIPGKPTAHNLPPSIIHINLFHQTPCTLHQHKYPIERIIETKLALLREPHRHSITQTEEQIKALKQEDITPYDIQQHEEYMMNRFLPQKYQRNVFRANVNAFSLNVGSSADGFYMYFNYKPTILSLLLLISLGTNPVHLRNLAQFNTHWLFQQYPIHNILQLASKHPLPKDNRGFVYNTSIAAAPVSSDAIFHPGDSPPPANAISSQRLESDIGREMLFYINSLANFATNPPAAQPPVIKPSMNPPKSAPPPIPGSGINSRNPPNPFASTSSAVPPPIPPIQNNNTRQPIQTIPPRIPGNPPPIPPIPGSSTAPIDLKGQANIMNDADSLFLTIPGVVPFCALFPLASAYFRLRNPNIPPNFFTDGDDTPTAAGTTTTTTTTTTTATNENAMTDIEPTTTTTGNNNSDRKKDDTLLHGDTTMMQNPTGTMDLTLVRHFPSRDTDEYKSLKRIGTFVRCKYHFYCFLSTLQWLLSTGLLSSPITYTVTLIELSDLEYQALHLGIPLPQVNNALLPNYIPLPPPLPTQRQQLLESGKLPRPTGNNNNNMSDNPQLTTTTTTSRDKDAPPNPLEIAYASIPSTHLITSHDYFYNLKHYDGLLLDRTKLPQLTDKTTTNNPDVQVQQQQDKMENAITNMTTTTTMTDEKKASPGLDGLITTTCKDASQDNNNNKIMTATTTALSTTGGNAAAATTTIDGQRYRVIKSRDDGDLYGVQSTDDWLDIVTTGRRNPLAPNYARSITPLPPPSGVGPPISPVGQIDYMNLFSQHIFQNRIYKERLFRHAYCYRTIYTPYHISQITENYTWDDANSILAEEEEEEKRKKQRLAANDSATSNSTGGMNGSTLVSLDDGNNNNTHSSRLRARREPQAAQPPPLPPVQQQPQPPANPNGVKRGRKRAADIQAAQAAAAAASASTETNNNNNNQNMQMDDIAPILTTTIAPIVNTMNTNTTTTTTTSTTNADVNKTNTENPTTEGTKPAKPPRQRKKKDAQAAVPATGETNNIPKDTLPVTEAPTTTNNNTTTSTTAPVQPTTATTTTTTPATTTAQDDTTATTTTTTTTKGKAGRKKKDAAVAGQEQQGTGVTTTTTTVKKSKVRSANLAAAIQQSQQLQLQQQQQEQQQEQEQTLTTTAAAAPTDNNTFNLSTMNNDSMNDSNNISFTGTSLVALTHTSNPFEQAPIALLENNSNIITSLHNDQQQYTNPNGLTNLPFIEINNPPIMGIMNNGIGDHNNDHNHTQNNDNTHNNNNQSMGHEEQTNHLYSYMIPPIDPIAAAQRIELLRVIQDINATQITLNSIGFDAAEVKLEDLQVMSYDDLVLLRDELQQIVHLKQYEQQQIDIEIDIGHLEEAIQYIRHLMWDPGEAQEAAKFVLATSLYQQEEAAKPHHNARYSSNYHHLLHDGIIKNTLNEFKHKEQNAKTDQEKLKLAQPPLFDIPQKSTTEPEKEKGKEKEKSKKSKEKPTITQRILQTDPSHPPLEPALYTKTLYSDINQAQHEWEMSQIASMRNEVWRDLRQSEHFERIARQFPDMGLEKLALLRERYDALFSVQPLPQLDAPPQIIPPSRLGEDVIKAIPILDENDVAGNNINAKTIIQQIAQQSPFIQDKLSKDYMNLLRLKQLQLAHEVDKVSDKLRDESDQLNREYLQAEANVSRGHLANLASIYQIEVAHNDMAATMNLGNKDEAIGKKHREELARIKAELSREKDKGRNELKTSSLGRTAIEQEAELRIEEKRRGLQPGSLVMGWDGRKFAPIFRKKVPDKVIKESMLQYTATKGLSLTQPYGLENPPPLHLNRPALPPPIGLTKKQREELANDIIRKNALASEKKTEEMTILQEVLEGFTNIEYNTKILTDSLNEVEKQEKSIRQEIKEEMSKQRLDEMVGLIKNILEEHKLEQTILVDKNKKRDPPRDYITRAPLTHRYGLPIPSTQPNPNPRETSIITPVIPETEVSIWTKVFTNLTKIDKSKQKEKQQQQEEKNKNNLLPTILPPRPSDASIISQPLSRAPPIPGITTTFGYGPSAISDFMAEYNRTKPFHQTTPSVGMPSTGPRIEPLQSLPSVNHFAARQAEREAWLERRKQRVFKHMGLKTDDDEKTKTNTKTTTTNNNNKNKNNTQPILSTDDLQPGQFVQHLERQTKLLNERLGGNAVQQISPYAPLALQTAPNKHTAGGNLAYTNTFQDPRLIQRLPYTNTYIRQLASHQRRRDLLYEALVNRQTDTPPPRVVYWATGGLISAEQNEINVRKDFITGTQTWDSQYITLPPEIINLIRFTPPMVDPVVPISYGLKMKYRQALNNRELDEVFGGNDDEIDRLEFAREEYEMAAQRVEEVQEERAFNDSRRLGYTVKPETEMVLNESLQERARAVELLLGKYTTTLDRDITVALGRCGPKPPPEQMEDERMERQTIADDSLATLCEDFSQQTVDVFRDIAENREELRVAGPENARKIRRDYDFRLRVRDVLRQYGRLPRDPEPEEILWRYDLPEDKATKHYKEKYLSYIEQHWVLYEQQLSIHDMYEHLSSLPLRERAIECDMWHDRMLNVHDHVYHVTPEELEECCASDKAQARVYRQFLFAHPDYREYLLRRRDRHKEGYVITDRDKVDDQKFDVVEFHREINLIIVDHQQTTRRDLEGWEALYRHSHKRNMDNYRKMLDEQLADYYEGRRIWELGRAKLLAEQAELAKQQQAEKDKVKDQVEQPTPQVQEKQTQDNNPIGDNNNNNMEDTTDDTTANNNNNNNNNNMEDTTMVDDLTEQNKNENIQQNQNENIQQSQSLQPIIEEPIMESNQVEQITNNTTSTEPTTTTNAQDEQPQQQINLEQQILEQHTSQQTPQDPQQNIEQQQIVHQQEQQVVEQQDQMLQQQQKQQDQLLQQQSQQQQQITEQDQMLQQQQQQEQLLQQQQITEEQEQLLQQQLQEQQEQLRQQEEEEQLRQEQLLLQQILLQNQMHNGMGDEEEQMW